MKANVRVRPIWDFGFKTNRKMNTISEIRNPKFEIILAIFTANRHANLA